MTQVSNVLSPVLLLVSPVSILTLDISQGVLAPLSLAWDETESLSRTESRMSKIVRVSYCAKIVLHFAH